MCLWNWPSLDMETAFVGMATATMLPGRRDIQGRVPSLIQNALVIFSPKAEYMKLGQIGVPEGIIVSNEAGPLEKW